MNKQNRSRPRQLVYVVVKLGVLSCFALTSAKCPGGDDNGMNGPTPIGNAIIECLSLNQYQINFGLLNTAQLNLGDVFVLNMATMNATRIVSTDVPADQLQDGPRRESIEFRMSGDFEVTVDAAIEGIKADVERHVENSRFFGLTNQFRRNIADPTDVLNRDATLKARVKEQRSRDPGRTNFQIIYISSVMLADSASFLLEDQSNNKGEVAVLDFADGTATVKHSDLCSVSLKGQEDQVFFKASVIDYDFNNDRVFLDVGTDIDLAGFQFSRATPFR